MSAEHHIPQSALPDTDIPDEIHSSFVRLGLAPTAGADLVDLAYRHHVRAAGTRQPNKEAIAMLDRAHELLSGMAMPVTPVRPPPPDAEEQPHTAAPRASWRGRWFARQDQATASRGPAHGLTPYQMLRIDPAAEPELVALVYRHLLRAAARTGDALAFEGLERAYALVGSAAARTQCDDRGLLLDIRYASPESPRAAIAPSARTSEAGIKAKAPADGDELISAPAGGYA